MLSSCSGCSSFDALVSEDYSFGADIEKYQSVLEHALSNVDVPIDAEFYTLPSNLNLNPTLKLCKTDTKICTNRNMNKAKDYHPKYNSSIEQLWPSCKHILFVKCIRWRARISQWKTTRLYYLKVTKKMFAEKHHDEKLAILLIVATRLVTL